MTAVDAESTAVPWWRRAWAEHPVVVVAALVFAAFVVVGFVGSLVDGPFDPAKVGTLGEWAAAVGTLLAVSVALWEVSASQRRQRELELERNELAAAEAERARRAQAEQVHAWCVSEHTYSVFLDHRHIHHHESVYDHQAARQDVEIAVANRSEQPVYDVEVHHAWWKDVRTRGRGGITFIAFGPAAAVGPGDRLDVQLRRVPDGEPEQWPAIELRFTDAAGTRWWRNAYGELSEDTARARPAKGAWSTEDGRPEFRAAYGLPPVEETDRPPGQGGGEPEP